MIDLIHAHVLPAAFAVLPSAMNSRGAQAMLLCIGLQESRFTERRQIGGPARGFWQFEVTGVRAVATHHASAPLLGPALSELRYPPGVSPAETVACHSVLEHNDVLAAVFARLLLYTLPAPLPGPHDYDESWVQYKRAWNPGAPHRATWNGFYAVAWTMVNGPPVVDVSGHVLGDET